MCSRKYSQLLVPVGSGEICTTTVLLFNPDAVYFCNNLPSNCALIIRHDDAAGGVSISKEYLSTSSSLPISTERAHTTGSTFSSFIPTKASRHKAFHTMSSWKYSQLLVPVGSGEICTITFLLFTPELVCFFSSPLSAEAPSSLSTITTQQVSHF